MRHRQRDLQLPDFGMSGTSVKTVERRGVFLPRTRVFSGLPHTFSPSYSLQATVVTAYTCTASAQDCATAAMQGVSVNQIPCESTCTEPATNRSDPSLP